jgi:hypothetical protein
VPKKKSVWSKELPSEEGWYWVKFKAHGTVETVCPALVEHTTDGMSLVLTAHLAIVFVYQGKNPMVGPVYRGKIDKTVRYGPMIDEPE